LSDDDLALAKKNKVALVSTDFTEKALRANGMDEIKAKKVHARYVERLRRAWKAGVAIVFGTDVMVEVKGETRGTLAIEYVDSFAEAGLPPREVLKAMTSEAARLLGVDAERGALKPGQAADIVAMPRNPLEDLSALKSVSFVMRNGAIVRQ
jgi:imidazolonepropionase-like amidohydrolase